MQQDGSRAAALLVASRSTALLLRDLNCCGAAVRLRFVVCGQGGASTFATVALMALCTPALNLTCLARSRLSSGAQIGSAAPLKR
jgi:hypothetical protein